MASGTLYTYCGSFRANKILIAASYSGANVQVASDFEYGKTNTCSNFLKKFPLGKVPAFESNGTYLNESDAIAQFVSNEALLGGSDAASQAAVREYISFSENEIIPSACTWVFPTLGFKQYNKQDTDKAMDHLKKCLTKLNNDLLTKTFLVGERVTLADITLCTSLVMLYTQVLDAKTREPFGNVNRWFMTCVNQPNFKKTLGQVTLCEKMATFDNKRYQELHQKGGKDKKTDKKPKEEKAKAAKPQALAAEPEKPKKIDYFKDVPKSDFNLEEWKKCYVNEVDVTISKKYFQDNFDKNAFSMWVCDYKYPDENEMKMLTNNLIGGFLQRIDGLRKHTQGIMVSKYVAATNSYTITGIWLTRGQKVPFSLNPDWNIDAPQFFFEKIDPTEGKGQEIFYNYYYVGCDKNGEDVLVDEMQTFN